MLDSAQITILALAGIVLAFYLKYKITGSIKAEFRFIGRILNRIYPALALLACAGSLMAAAVGVMAVADAFMKPSETGHAVITAKNKYYRGKQATSYSIRARGDKKEYNESVSPGFYHSVQIGDTIIVQLTPLFGEWKSVRAVRDGKVVCTGRGSDIYAMAVIGCVFVLTLFSFPLYFRMRNQRIAGSVVFIFIILFELIPLTIILQEDAITAKSGWICSKWCRRPACLLKKQAESLFHIPNPTGFCGNRENVLSF